MQTIKVGVKRRTRPFPAMRRPPLIEGGTSMECLVEPERIIKFRVPWEDDQGNIHVNRGFRVQFSSAIGPYKGGLRFHPSVYEGIIKFLGFEQIFKNASPACPSAAARAARLRPQGQVRRRGHALLPVVHVRALPYIGPDTDVPAGDIGVGGREIGLSLRPVQAPGATNSPACSPARASPTAAADPRTEATGYGPCYFADNMLKAAARASRASAPS
jgi:glutamate dehydrogenase (NADP+)